MKKIADGSASAHRAAPTAAALVAALHSGAITARATAETALTRIAAHNPRLRACTAVFADEALEAADRCDARLRAGQLPRPLEGVPVVVKNLFDVAGHTTLAGARSRLSAAPAVRDATVVERLRGAGAIIIAATNMDEFAYGFTTENAHFGTTRNPHDPERLAGGSSGGSAAAVAAGMAPIGLGTDTNGSVRVPAAWCGVFGMKPTFGRLSRAGVFPFAASLDHVGHMARSVQDLTLAYEVMQGSDPRDPVCTPRGHDSCLAAITTPHAGLRIARLGGWFEHGADTETLANLAQAARALGAMHVVDVPDAGAARAAAYLITAAEGGNLHREGLAHDPLAYDPGCRDRLLAGLLAPAHLLLQAQRFRRRFQASMRTIFERYDVLLAPATPGAALKVGQATERAHIGIYTQPLSYIGLPIVVAPIPRPGRLPIGIQIIAAPWREDLALQVAAQLEAAGIAAAPTVE